MDKVRITLKRKNAGWVAGIVIPPNATTGTNMLTIKIKEFPTKYKAWNSIKGSIEKLGFENDQVFFNNKPVASFKDINDLMLYSFDKPYL